MQDNHVVYKQIGRGHQAADDDDDAVTIANQIIPMYKSKESTPLASKGIKPNHAISQHHRTASFPRTVQKLQTITSLVAVR